MSAWCGFVQGPWPFTEVGGPNTPLQVLVVEMCLGYFLFDFSWCLYFRSEGGVMLLHHSVSIMGLLVTTVTGYYGTEMIAAIFGSEMTNPLLQSRWFLKETGKYDTLLGEIVDHAFVIMFGVLRIGVGTYLLYSYYQQDTDFLGRFSGTTLYAISWIFWISIVQYAVHKYQKKFKTWAKIAAAKKQRDGDSKSQKVSGHIDSANGSFSNSLANGSLPNKSGSDSNQITDENGDLNFSKTNPNSSSELNSNDKPIFEENADLGKLDASYLNGDLHHRKPASREVH